MLDVKRLRQDPEGARAALARRCDPALDTHVAHVLELDRQRRDIVTRTEQLKAERNVQNDEVARRRKVGEAADELMAARKQSGEESKRLDAEQREADARLEQVMLELPNFVQADVPDGDASANAVVRHWGDVPTFAFEPKAHWDLGAALGLFDLPAGAKITGSGFPLFTGPGAKLVRALANFMLDLHTTAHGYLEIAPPFLVNQASLIGTGQLPKFADELYTAEKDGLYLIPTAEVPVTNIHRDEILEAADLPRTFVAYTPCFRREAGSGGKDTRGLIRVHQFDKVELVRLEKPDDSEAAHASITQHAETVLQQLELPYRVLALAAGDTGFASARTFDLEAWAPGVGNWLEVSSSSTFTDFQARRANIRYRPSPKAKPEFVHTLNASGVAFPRTIIALLENHQQADGSVRVPAALVPYLGTDCLRPRA